VQGEADQPQGTEHETAVIYWLKDAMEGPSEEFEVRILAICCAFLHTPLDFSRLFLHAFFAFHSHSHIARTFAGGRR